MNQIIAIEISKKYKLYVAKILKLFAFQQPTGQNLNSRNEFLEITFLDWMTLVGN